MTKTTRQNSRSTNIQSGILIIDNTQRRLESNDVIITFQAVLSSKLILFLITGDNELTLLYTKVF